MVRSTAPQTCSALNFAAQGNVLPFRVRAASAVRSSSFAQLMLQPRLAMTAAMAFLSIALTLDLTGVRLQDLRASDLRPSSLKRDFYSANARVVQYYEGLRVVYELESRVHDLQSATDNDAPAASDPSRSARPTPNQPASQPAPGEPAPAHTTAAAEARAQLRHQPPRRRRHTIQFAAYASRKAPQAQSKEASV